MWLQDCYVFLNNGFVTTWEKIWCKMQIFKNLMARKFISHKSIIVLFKWYPKLMYKPLRKHDYVIKYIAVHYCLTGIASLPYIWNLNTAYGGRFLHISITFTVKLNSYLMNHFLCHKEKRIHNMSLIWFGKSYIYPE